MLVSLQGKRPTDSTASLEQDRLPRRLAVVWTGAGSRAAHAEVASNATQIIRLCLELGRIESIILCACRGHAHAAMAKRTKPSYLAVPLLKRYGEKLTKAGARFSFLGALDELAPAERELFRTWERRRPRSPRLEVSLAVNYSGRGEILGVTRALARDVRLGKLLPVRIGEDLAAARIRAGQPELDLLIRTGGEMTPGDFMLWDLSYAEFVTVPEPDPEFGAAHFVKALLEYQSRKRRFGAR